MRQKWKSEDADDSDRERKKLINIRRDYEKCVSDLRSHRWSCWNSDYKNFDDFFDYIFAFVKQFENDAHLLMERLLWYGTDGNEAKEQEKRDAEGLV